MEKLQLHVVGARRYSFNDKDTGRLVEGVNVFYLNQDKTDSDAVGQVPAKVTLPYEFWGKISKFDFPSVCGATLQQTLTAKGVKTNVIDIDFIKKV